MNQSTFIFRPLEEKHLDILCVWLQKPHIKEWWNDNLNTQEIKAKYKNRIGNQIVSSFVAFIGNKPIGFIQYYYANKVENGRWENETDDTIGIDLFIGEENYIDEGYGSQMLAQFLVKLFSETNAKKIITDIKENNLRAIRCFEKQGFYFSHKETTPEGTFNVMNKYWNTSIEPHAPLLKKPNRASSLYKIVSFKNFTDMVEKGYLYFRRVDTYIDDTRDSDQPDKDKEISERSKFEKAPNYSLKNYYDSCRAKTYACCFSTENTSHIWENYGDNDGSAVCLVFDSHKLINFLNLSFHDTKLIYQTRILKNFFYINYGLVTYGNFNEAFIKKHTRNPIEYVYYKNIEKYKEEKEFRISLSCSGMPSYMLPDGTEFSFPESLMLSFNLTEAIKRGVLKQIIINGKANDKDEIKEGLSALFDTKGVTVAFVEH